MGHNSKAVHRTYAKHAEVTVPSLADWEKDWQENPQGSVQPKLLSVDFRLMMLPTAHPRESQDSSQQRQDAFMMRPPDALKSVASRAPARLLPAGVAFPDAMATFRFNLVPNTFSSSLRPAVRRTGK